MDPALNIGGLLNPIGQTSLFVAAAFLVAGCTTVAYDGASRPDSEVATIASERTMIAAIDGKDVPYSGGNYATFKVLPGEHTISVKLNDTSTYPGTRFSKNALPVVFSAEAGKAYVTRPAYNGNTWRPEISERTVQNASATRK
jgi:hypothetical protein